MPSRRRRKGPRQLWQFRCRSCAVRFKEWVYEGDPDPQCPNLDCRAVQVPIGFDPGQGKAPAAVGMKPLSVAMDATADIVMQDYQITDMKDVVRAGEDSAPKLPPGQQVRADAMFDAKRRAQLFNSGGPINPLAQVVNGIAHGAMPQLAVQAGERDAMADLHRRRYKPKVHFVNPE